jgi:predicted nucleic acid-binding protein
MSLTNRDQIIQALQQANQPNQEEQQEAQVRKQVELETAMAMIEKLKAETAEIVSRIEQNNVETQLLPIEEETKRIAAMASNIPKDKSEFDKLVDYAKLELSEKELDMKKDIVKLQMQK